MTVPPSVLLLNDTDEDATHFGCMRVMRTLRKELARRGLDNLPSIKVGTDWRRDQALRAKVDAARLVVINGEGTLHHGKRRGRWLLEAGDRVRQRGGHAVLINALWQDNPDDWAGLASGFDLLACRDSRSAAALTRQSGQTAVWMGDLSMFHRWPAEGTGVKGSERHGIIVGCSVHGRVTEHLAALAHELRAEFMPVTTAIKAPPARLTGLRRWMREQRAAWQNRNFLRRWPETRFVRNDDDYLGALSQRELLVTGRFHAVCLAVLSRTPFLATASNSWKIEALIHDIGLNPERALPLEELTAAQIAGRDWRFSAEELAAMDDALARWRSVGADIFDRIAALSR